MVSICDVVSERGDGVDVYICVVKVKVIDSLHLQQERIEEFMRFQLSD